MAEAPIISIIIPVFNRENFIQETLDSILKQEFEAWECIIVDDGSTDSSWKIISDYATKDDRFSTYKRPENIVKGANSCRNYGFDKATGEFIQWFDSDDVMLPKKLKMEYEAILIEGTDYCISLARIADAQLNPKELIKFELDSEHTIFRNYALGSIEVITQMVLWRNSFLTGKELFNPIIKRGQETEFYSRMFFESNRFSLVQTESLLYRQHDATKTSKNANQYIPAYRHSQSYISCQFYKLGERRSDSAIMKRYYKFLVHFLYEAATQRDKVTAQFILKKLHIEIIPLDSKRLRSLRFGAKVLSLTGRKNAYIQKTFFDYNL